MNTFIPYDDPVASAGVMDRQRLGKQRVLDIHNATIEECLKVA